MFHTKYGPGVTPLCQVIPSYEYFWYTPSSGLLSPHATYVPPLISGLYAIAYA